MTDPTANRSPILNPGEPPLPPSGSPMSPTVQNIAASLRLTGWVCFWVQLAILIVSGVILIFAAFSRNVDEDTSSAATGLCIALAFVAIGALIASVVFSFRYIRLGKRLTLGTIQRSPSEVKRMVTIGLLISIGGLAISALGTEVGTGILLAKSLSQPQGAAVYTPDKIIRVLDILVVLSCSSLILAHLAGCGGGLWLMLKGLEPQR